MVIIEMWLQDNVYKNNLWIVLYWKEIIGLPFTLSCLFQRILFIWTGCHKNRNMMDLIRHAMGWLFSFDFGVGWLFRLTLVTSELRDRWCQMLRLSHVGLPDWLFQRVFFGSTISSCVWLVDTRWTHLGNSTVPRMVGRWWLWSTGSAH